MKITLEGEGQKMGTKNTKKYKKEEKISLPFGMDIYSKDCQ